MSKNKRKRVQTPKVGNLEMAKAFQELRRSSAAEPHRNKARYNRNVKHKNKGWD